MKNPSNQHNALYEPKYTTTISHLSTAHNSMSPECPICFNPYSDQLKPKSLPCGHSICSNCVTNLNQSASDSCPICKKKVPNWSQLPDNFTLIELINSGPPQLPASQEVAQYFASIRVQQKSLNVEIERDKRRERDWQPQAGNPAPANSPEHYQQMVHLHVEEYRLQFQEFYEVRSKMQHEGLEITQVQRIITTCEVIYTKITLKSEAFLRPQLPRQYPLESEENPLALSIAILQDQLNSKMRMLQAYVALLAELEDFAQLLAQEKAKILQLYGEEHAKYESQHVDLNRDFQQSAQKNAQIKSYIEKLQGEEIAFAERRRVLAYEKEKSMLGLEILARENIQALYKEMEAVDTASTPALTAAKKRIADTFGAFKAYLKFLKDREAAETAKVKAAAERVESLEKRVNSASHIEEIEGNVEIVRRTKVHPEREIETIKQIVADLKQEEEKEKRGVAAARSQASMCEQKVKDATGKASALARTIDTDSAQAAQLAAECKRLDGLRTALWMKWPELERRRKEAIDKGNTVDFALVKAEQYLGDVLLPTYERSTADCSQLQQKRSREEASFRTQLKALEEKQSRLTIQQFSAAPTYASTPPPSPIRSLTNTIPVLTAAKDRVEADCQRLEDQIRGRNQAIESRKAAMPSTRPEAHMAWALLVSLAAMFLVLTWGNSAI